MRGNVGVTTQRGYIGIQNRLGKKYVHSKVYAELHYDVW